MDDKSFKTKQRWRAVILIFGVYTLYLLMQVPQIYFYNSGSRQPASFVLMLLRLSLAIYIWALLTPLILWAGKLLPINRRHLVRNLLLHFCFSLVLGLAQTVAYHLGIAFINQIPIIKAFEPLANPGFFLNFVTNAVVFYTAISAIYQAFLQFREVQEREYRLQQAELQTLKTQLHPHFLFNTINAISALIYEAPETADKTLTELSDLLRLALKSNKDQETTLKEELDFLRKYLCIHQTLMNERLKVNWLISPETLDAAVPNMILQPLVENSIRHGLSPLERGGTIEISSHRNNGNLCLQITDNGTGLKSDQYEKSDGIGLANTRARLSYLYGEKHKLAFDQQPGSGVTVTINVPFQLRKPVVSPKVSHESKN